MYYAEIETVSDRLGAFLMHETIMGVLKGILLWEKDYKVEVEDIKEVLIRVKDTNLLVLKAKFIEPNALEISY